MPASKERIEEIKARVAAIGFQVLRTGLESIKRPMTEQELADLAKEMDEHILEHARLEERKKESAKAFKDSMDKEIEEARALAELRDKGYNDVNENCIIAYDPGRNLICVFDPVTGYESITRMVTDKDLQTAMPLEPEKAKEDAPTAPEAICIGFEGGAADQGPIEVEGTIIADIDLAEVLTDDAPERKTITDMVKSVTEQDGGFFIIETVDQTLYTDKPELAELANQIHEAKAYADFEIEATDETRNKCVFAITPRIVEDAEPEIRLPDGVEEADDLE